ncbi:MAG: hypothetical protein V8R40_13755 [Dysosmobacter sp.]
MEHRESIEEEVRRCGGEISNSSPDAGGKAFRQHGAHRARWRWTCPLLRLGLHEAPLESSARGFRVRAYRRALVRGALPHDYGFLCYLTGSSSVEVELPPESNSEGSTAIPREP